MTFLGLNDRGSEEYRSERDGSVLIRIPAGRFLMGTSDAEIRWLLREYPGSEAAWFQGERPRRSVVLDGFQIGKYEVTNVQFSRFVNDTGYVARGSWKDYAEPGREEHPVVSVTREDAAAYCAWAGLRLPSEAEWERAARGTDGRRFPWGDEWGRNLCNSLSADGSEIVASRTAGNDCPTIPVGLVPAGASPCGARDMAGNVWEWCTGDPGEPAEASSGGVVRGGSWHGDTPIPFRCAARLERPAGDSSIYAGFRCARDA